LWIASFVEIHAAVVGVRSLVRESAMPQKVHANAGYYQQSLESSQPYQMMRILL
jgi:cell division protein ZapD